MKRGEVWWVNFDPLTSKIDRIYPSEAFITINENRSKAMAYQLATVSKLRLINLLGKLSNSDMKKVEQAIKVQLGLLV